HPASLSEVRRGRISIHPFEPVDFVRFLTGHYWIKDKLIIFALPFRSSRSMRFSFLSAFPPYRGGIAQFSAALVRELRKDHEVAAFTFIRQYPDLLFPGTSQYDTGTTDSIGAHRVLDSINPLSWKRTARRMLESKPDVAVLRYWMPFFAPAMG